ncbi:MAG: transcriptional regulator [Firmicutes bacterium HGW-Firmicutes-11]|jgi:ArsR family transcriptional regulator|nr:MAG: transcriptional regulator [Firmicutes bacterium HGW-Firmicutes-11]
MDYKAYAMIMKALGDETRVKIFDMLSEGERCACKLLDEFSVTQPTLSYHMKILCDCGLVSARRDGIWMRYTVRQETLAEMIGFLNRIAEGIPEGIEVCDCKEAG